MKRFPRFAFAASFFLTPASPSWSKDNPTAVERGMPAKPPAIIFSPSEIDKDTGFCIFEPTQPNNTVETAIAAVGNNVGAITTYKNGTTIGVQGVHVESGQVLIATNQSYYVIVAPNGTWSARPSNPRPDAETRADIGNRIMEGMSDIVAAVQATRPLHSLCAGAIEAIPIKFPVGHSAAVPQPL